MRYVVNLKGGSRCIGKVLDAEGIMVRHIDEAGKLKDQKAVASEFNKGYQSGDLFGS